jgi:hypothetical protein
VRGADGQGSPAPPSQSRYWPGTTRLLCIDGVLQTLAIPRPAWRGWYVPLHASLACTVGFLILTRCRCLPARRSRPGWYLPALAVWLGQPGSRPCNPNFTIRSIAPLWAAQPIQPIQRIQPVQPSQPGDPGEFQGTRPHAVSRVGVCTLQSGSGSLPVLASPPTETSTAYLGPALPGLLRSCNHNPTFSRVQCDPKTKTISRLIQHWKLAATLANAEPSNCTRIACCNRRRRRAPPRPFLSNRASAPHRSATRPRRSRCLLPSCLPGSPLSPQPACSCFCSRSLFTVQLTQLAYSISTAQSRPAA